MQFIVDKLSSFYWQSVFVCNRLRFASGQDDIVCDLDYVAHILVAWFTRVALFKRVAWFKRFPRRGTQVALFAKVGLRHGSEYVFSVYAWPQTSVEHVFTQLI